MALHKGFYRDRDTVISHKGVLQESKQVVLHKEFYRDRDTVVSTFYKSRNR